MQPSSLLQRWRRRGDHRRLLAAGLAGGAVGLGLLFVPGPVSLPLRLGLGGAVVLLALGRAWSLRPSLRALARDVDAAAGGDGLLATALAVERGRAHGGDDLRGVVADAAVAAAPAMAVHAVPAFRWPGPAIGIGLALVLAGLLAPEQHAAPVAVAMREAVVGPASPAATPTASALEGGPSPRAALPQALGQASGGPRGEQTEGRASQGGQGAAPGDGAGTATGALTAATGEGEAGEGGGSERADLWRPDQPAAASQQLMSRPGTGRGDEDEGTPIQGGNQGAFGAGTPDEDDPMNPDAKLSTGGGEASGKEGGPGEDDPAPRGETNNGAAKDGGEGERKEGTGQGQAGSPGDPADGGPAPTGGDDARSKDDTQTTGPGAGAGADAVGTAEAEGDTPMGLPPLPDALSRIELAWKEGGDGTLREVEDAALGQRSTQAWRALHADYQAVAEHTLAREAVPPARAEAVRRYFDALSADDAKESP